MCNLNGGLFKLGVFVSYQITISFPFTLFFLSSNPLLIPYIVFVITAFSPHLTTFIPNFILFLSLSSASCTPFIHINESNEIMTFFCSNLFFLFQRLSVFSSIPGNVRVFLNVSTSRILDALTIRARDECSIPD
ncbi:hypothetical protein BJ165DRAFT_1428021 [Panaeolus papilionaceus]|nr:hypothetical protein BJ165DRAFT_1428021 [Panaeolus papilionaceus]